jgi:putative membrane protein
MSLFEPDGSASGDEPLQEAGDGPLHGTPTRLDPAAVWIWLGRSLVSLVVFMVVAGMVPLLGVAALGIVVSSQLLRYLRFRWRVEGNAVVIDQGFIIRSRRVIPRDRIQSVDMEQGPIHRLLGVMELRIESVGGQETQGRLVALEPEVAEELRAFLLRRSGSGAVDPTAESTTTSDIAPSDSETTEGNGETAWARSSPGRLVLAGLTGGRVGVVAALVGFLSQVIPETWWPALFGEAMGRVPDPSTLEGLRFLSLLGALAILTAFVLSVLATVVAHWGFTLSVSRSGGGLMVRRGLLTRHRDTVPLRRIQAIRVEENLFRRILGMGALRAVVAGRAGSGEGGGTSLLLPLGRRGELYHLALRALGVDGGEERREGSDESPEVWNALAPLHPMPRRALRRRQGRALLAALALGLGTWILLLTRDAAASAAAGVAGGVLVTALLAGWYLAHRAYGSLGWADSGTHLVVREGVFTRRTTFLLRDRIQALETRATPLQRRKGLATVHLWVAGSDTGPPPRALDLDEEGAADWQESLTATWARE